MEHTAAQPVETVVDITCDVCRQSTSVEGYGQQFGTLQAHWGYGSKHDGERTRFIFASFGFPHTKRPTSRAHGQRHVRRGA